MAKYFGNWSTYESMVEGLSEGKYDYDADTYEKTLPTGLPTDEQVVFATYDTGDYTGKALVIYQGERGLMEWSASHCSCNGIRGEWDGGSPVTWEALALRVPEMGDDWGFLGKADAATRDAFVELVAINSSGQALLDAYHKAGVDPL